jgi:uncharacterized membrane protein
MILKKTILILLFFILILSGNLTSCKHAIVTPPPKSDLLFTQVRDIVNTNCIVCHTPGGEGMPVFLDSDSSIVLYAPQIKAATCDPASPFNRRMPPTGQLPDADTAIISQWFAGGGTMHNAGINK